MAEERLTDDPMKPHDDATPEEELGFRLREEPAEGEYDEDLVGLTPGEYEREMELRRAREEKVRRECEGLRKKGEKLMAEGNFRDAEKAFAEACDLADDPEEYAPLVWAARTENYTSTESLFGRGVARRLARESDKVRETVFAHMGSEITELKEEYEAEAAPLREEVEAGMESRREAFRENRNYWLVRFLISLGAFAVMVIACLVASGYLYRTRGALVPVLTAVFGVLAVAALGVTFFFSRKLYLGQKLVSDNEKLSSTEKGKRLDFLESRAAALALILEGERPDYGWEETEEFEESEEEGPGGEEIPEEMQETPGEAEENE